MTQWSFSTPTQAPINIKGREPAFTNAIVDSAAWAQAKEWGEKTREKFDHLVVIGFGGSSMGGRTLVSSLRSNSHKVSFWDNSDPQWIKDQFENLGGLDTTHWLFVSKSGQTLELFVLASMILDRLKSREMNFASRVTVLTEEGDNPLRQFAQSHSLQTLNHPHEIGGRFSVFSLTGLLPAAFAQYDLQALQRGAQKVLDDPSEAGALARFLVDRVQEGCTHLAQWNYSQDLNSWQDWFQQLYAESLGKNSTTEGQAAPVVPALTRYQGTRDHHSVLQHIVEGHQVRAVLATRVKSQVRSEVIANNYFSELNLKGLDLNSISNELSEGALESLREVNVPVAKVDILSLNEEALGQLLCQCLLAIVAVAEELKINPYGQPGVERAKVLARNRLQL